MLPGLNTVIDLSHHNQEARGKAVDYSAARADGIFGVIYKATQGTSIRDDTYFTNRQVATNAGLLWGAYHFGTVGDGVAQADYFLSVVNPDDRTLIALDLEDYFVKSGLPTKIMPRKEAEAFVTRVKDKTGRYPMLYTRRNLADDILKITKTSELAKCALWLSAYTSKPRIPAAWTDWTLWQYTGDDVGPNQPHSVAGVGACDRNTFNGDAVALNRLWGL